MIRGTIDRIFAFPPASPILIPVADAVIHLHDFLIIHLVTGQMPNPPRWASDSPTLLVLRPHSAISMLPHRQKNRSQSWEVKLMVGIEILVTSVMITISKP